MGRITIFTEPNCPSSSKLKAALDQRDVPYTEIDVDVHPERRADMLELCSNTQCPQTFFNTKHIGSTEETLATLVAWEQESIYTGHSAAERYIEIENEDDPKDERLREPPAKEDEEGEGGEGVLVEHGTVLALVEAISDVKDIQYDAAALEVENEEDEEAKDDIEEGKTIPDPASNDETEIEVAIDGDADDKETLANSQENQKTAAAMPIMILLAFRHLFDAFIRQSKSKFGLRRNNDSKAPQPSDNQGTGIDYDLENVDIPDIPEIEEGDDNEDSDASSTEDFSEAPSTPRASEPPTSIPTFKAAPKGKSKSKGSKRSSSILRRLPSHRRKNRGLQVLKSRSGSSDHSDPATTRSADSHISSGSSGDSGDKAGATAATQEGYSGKSSMHQFLTNLPANPDPYAARLDACASDGSASEAFDVSYHDDDDTLDNVSYTFSDDGRTIGAESREACSVVTDLSRGDEIRLSASMEDDELVDLDDISLLDEEEAVADGFPSDEDGDDSFPGDETKATAVKNEVEDDPYEDIQPLFKHHSLRQASQIHTSYDFAVNEQRDDIACAQMLLNEEAGYDMVDL